MKNSLITASKLCLIVLFAYAGFVKLTDLKEFQLQMYQSPVIPEAVIPTLSYLLPLSEIGLAFLLLFERTEKTGFFLSFFIMFFFSLYMIGLVAFYVKVPCSCGGILGHMSYTVHIIFNLTFTILALISYLSLHKTESTKLQFS